MIGGFSTCFHFIVADATIPSKPHMSVSSKEVMILSPRDAVCAKSTKSEEEQYLARTKLKLLRKPQSKSRPHVLLRIIAYGLVLVKRMSAIKRALNLS